MHCAALMMRIKQDLKVWNRGQMQLSEISIVNGRHVLTSSLPDALKNRPPLLNVGVFETMRSYTGNIFELDAHAERLSRGLEFLGIKSDSSKLLDKGLLDALLAENKLMDAYVRATAVIREFPNNLGNDFDLYIIAGPIQKYDDELYKKGMRLKTSDLVRNERSELSRHKSCAMLDNFLAHQKAHRDGYDTALLLNTEGNVAETAWANIFMVQGGRLHTPRIEDGALPGVTRKVILEIAQNIGVPVEVRKISCSELAGSDEIFITNTLMQIMPVSEIDGHPTSGALLEGSMMSTLYKHYLNKIDIANGSFVDLRKST